jgi:cyclase
MQNGRVVKGVHFVDIRDAVQAGATILLAASVFHFHIIDIQELKSYLKKRGVQVK